MKRFSIFLMTITFAGLLTTGCGSNNTASTTNDKDSASTFDLNAMKKTIEEKDNEFAKAFVTGDSVTMVNSFTQDGKIFPPNSDAAIGRSAIAGLISQYLKFGIKKFHDETTALYGNEANLIEEGNYLMGDDKGNTIDKGKYIDIWRKVDGDWKIYSEIFNTSMPAAPAK
jgi:ketosteroid isomerase-like protein